MQDGMPGEECQDCSSATSTVVRVGDGGTEGKTGGRDGGGIVEDVTNFVRSDKNGQGQK